jgi:cytochrome b subunit of formate dehydrogenase/nitrate/TMAO reductase-like tetraheme cytochrome c subunit
MKRQVSAALALLFALLWVAAQFTGPSRAARAEAQAGTQAAPAAGQQSAPAAQAPPPVTPNPGGTVAGQLGMTDSQKTLQCQGCHAPDKPPPYLAGDRFHREAHAANDRGAHGAAIRAGRRGASCLDCHSSNGAWDTVFHSSDPRSTVNRVNVSETCGKCHDQPLGSFHDSIHGLGQRRGVNVAATCSDCHGAHEALPATDPRSLLSKANTPATCAKCHQSALTDFQTSSHFAALARGDQKAPVCTTCHTSVSHASAPASVRDFSLDTVNQCARCHQKQAPSYRDTFHGQATALGFKPAATCADCHTPHQNLPASEPRSSVHRANLVQTCGACHQNATQSFVTYDPHAEPHNRERSALVWGVTGFMELLFIGVFGFFGLHTLLWLQRSVVGLLRGEGHRFNGDEQWVVRFNKSNRWTHVAIVVSFLVLAATGLPLMYYFTGWGQNLAQALGGVGATRLLHRVFAVVTFGYAFYHLGYLLWLKFVKKERGLFFGPDSMTPRPKDFQDLYRMVRWFLYIDKRPPRFDRWTYWEKFDYFAVFWGVPVIGLSGLVLWFPAFFSQFIPGSWLNVAMIVHGEEALLATGFIFAFHFFHNHMRPENFPLDTVIFTGRIPLRRFKAERPKEYLRLRREGRLGEVLTTPPTRRARVLATAFGFTAYIVGLVLVVAIFATLVFGGHDAGVAL